MGPRRGAERAFAALDAQLRLLDESRQGAVKDADVDSADALRLACAHAVLRGLDRGVDPAPGALRETVRLSLDRLAAAAPGTSVEVRVPPYAAVQCVPGPRHTRGTPPAVVETDPRTWLDLAAGRIDWRATVAAGRVHASGERTDLSPYLPLNLD